SGNLCFGIDDDSTWDPDDSVCTSSTIENTGWKHVEVVRESGVLTLYLDGVAVASDTSLAATGSLSGTSPTLYLGVDSDGASNYLTGSLDETKFYNYARSDDQILEDLNGGHPVGGSPVGSPVVDLRLEEGFGDKANDTSVNSAQADLGGS